MCHVRYRGAYVLTGNSIEGGRGSISYNTGFEVYTHIKQLRYKHSLSTSKGRKPPFTRSPNPSLACIILSLTNMQMTVVCPWLVKLVNIFLTMSQKSWKANVVYIAFIILVSVNRTIHSLTGLQAIDVVLFSV